MVESVGRDCLIRDRAQDLTQAIEGVPYDKILDYVNYMQEDVDNTYPEAHVIFNQADVLLSTPFDFYGASLQLNNEQQIDLSNRAYVRFYKMKINQLYADIEGLQAEIDANRLNIKSMADNANLAQNEIMKLETKLKIAHEDKLDTQNKFFILVICFFNTLT